jgi:hypothetical protein
MIHSDLKTVASGRTRSIGLFDNRICDRRQHENPDRVRAMAFSIVEWVVFSDSASRICGLTSQANCSDNARNESWPAEPIWK